MLGIFAALFRYRDAKSPDKLGLYPQIVHTKALPERRYLWTSRLLVIIAVINISLTIVFSAIIYILLPQKTYSPILLYAKQNLLSNVAPLQQVIRPQLLQTEGFIRDYVTMRHSLPKSYIELNRMWREGSLFYAYSAPEVWQSFNASVDYKKMSKFLRKGYWRDIEIKDIKQLSNNFYSVVFITTTGIKESSKTAQAQWAAYLHIAYQTYDASNPPAWYVLNPFGFKVVGYTLNYMGNPASKKDK